MRSPTIVKLLALAASLPAALPAAAQAQGARAPENKAYDAVLEGMSCRQHTSGRLDCAYAVGSGLRFSIAGVGQDDAVISFARVDSAAGWVAALSVLHGCVVVRPAAAAPDSAAALAFISPRDGRVYRVWQHCRQPPRR